MNPFDLSGRTALVTGGNGGIGLGMAQGLAQAGAKIAIAGRDKAKNAQAAKALDAIALEADLKDEKACRAMVEAAAKRLGRLDILINNAGMNVRKQPQEFTLEEWKLVMDTNLTSAFVASQTAYAHMKKAGGGKIVNIGSMMSIFGASFTTAYAASKGGIVQMTRAMATAWARDNIQVNAVLPGWIDTALTRGAREQVKGLHRACCAARPPGAGASRRICRGLQSFFARPHLISSPVPRSRWTAATRCRARTRARSSRR